jgi:hypothetical protein
LVAALAGAATASAVAAPGVRPILPPVFHAWHGGERRMVWRDHGGERHALWREADRRRDFRRDGRGNEYGGLDGGFYGYDEADDNGSEAAPSPLIVSAPISVSVTFDPASAAPSASTGGPKLIEVGRSAAPRRPLPRVVYGE